MSKRDRLLRLEKLSTGWSTTPVVKLFTLYDGDDTVITDDDGTPITYREYCRRHADDLHPSGGHITHVFVDLDTGGRTLDNYCGSCVDYPPGAPAG